MRTLPAAALAAALLPAAAYAGDGGTELALFDLDEQLKAETSVASVKARSIRETPGIVSVIGRDEFLATGARNLFDVLAMVPGFQIGGEIGNTTGLGFRGMWGSEGKVLVLVDGLPVNDLLGGGVQADAIPLEQVQSVEVVRGPGSALYGGFAELAVVQITTRGAAELERGAAAASVGQMRNGLGSRTLNAGWGRRFESGWFTVQATVGHAERSDRAYIDGLGQSASFAGNSKTDPVSVAAGAAWGGLQLRFRYQDWRNETVDGYGDVLPAPVAQRFRSIAGEARWDLALGEGLVLTPRVLAQRTTPWQQLLPSDYGIYDRTGERLTGRVALTWHASPALEVMAGAEAFVERSYANAGQVVSGPDDPLGSSARYTTTAGFGEVSWDTSVVNLLAGARFEDHERYGSSFVPRIAATRLFAPFHAKLIFSRAYRAPTLDNLASNPGLQPEHTRFYEAELGWQASEHFFAVVNAFDARIEDAIVYTTDTSQGASGQDLYLNSGRTGSHGIEVDARFQARAFSASAGYAFYTAQGVNQVAAYDVPGHPHLMLGFAGHKVTARATARLPRSLDLTATAVWLSDRYGDTATGADGQPVLGHVPAKLQIGFFAWWRDVGARGLDLGAGVHDLLDAGSEYVLPYHSVNGVHPPLPAASREVFLRIAWEPR
ncbi:MAG TPA: TonB-dependent receptor [Anaeromyxobacteraceae bacterium]|nr:TonB-dependent receptor [Anaeromyxobacteraceae bacterium]